MLIYNENSPLARFDSSSSAPLGVSIKQMFMSVSTAKKLVGWVIFNKR